VVITDFSEKKTNTEVRVAIERTFGTTRKRIYARDVGRGRSIERRQLESKHEVFKEAELIKSHGVAEHGYLFEDGPTAF
jgi:hypothetical protein